MKQKNKGPEFLKFFNPLLETLHELGGAGRASDVRPLVIEKLKISEKDISVTLKSGVSRIYNQIDWARNYLKSVGYVSSEKHGVWKLTDKIPSLPMSDDFIYNLFTTVQDKFLKDNADRLTEAKEETTDETITPEKQHQITLLEYLQTISPHGFERLCKRLLIEEGFQNVTVTKKNS
jgi:restriction system protein